MENKAFCLLMKLLDENKCEQNRRMDETARRLEEIHEKLEEISTFRWKLVGASMGVSGICTLLVHAASFLLSHSK